MNNCCPNPNCQNQVQSLIKVHDKKRKRLICKVCNRTWYKNKSIQINLKSEAVTYNRAIQLLEHNYSIRITAKYTNKAPSTILRWKKLLKTN